MARPKKQDDYGRTEQVNLRLTIEEKQHLHERAIACGLTPTEYARRVIFSVPVSFRQEVDPALIFSLKKIGNNLNQISKVFNSGSQPPPIALTNIIEKVADVLNEVIHVEGYD
jgi:hypothetical protein